MPVGGEDNSSHAEDEKWAAENNCGWPWRLQMVAGDGIGRGLWGWIVWEKVGGCGRLSVVRVTLDIRQGPGQSSLSDRHIVNVAVISAKTADPWFAGSVVGREVFSEAVVLFNYFICMKYLRLHRSSVS